MQFVFQENLAIRIRGRVFLWENLMLKNFDFYWNCQNKENIRIIHRIAKHFIHNHDRKRFAIEELSRIMKL